MIETILEKNRKLKQMYFDAFGELPLSVDHDEEERQYGVVLSPRKPRDEQQDD